MFLIYNINEQQHKLLQFVERNLFASTIHIHVLQWLQLHGQQQRQRFRSSGGMEGDVSSSTVTAWGINVGSKLASGVAKECSVCLWRTRLKLKCMWHNFLCVIEKVS